MPEKVLEILCDLANGLEAAAVNLKHQIAALEGIKEEQDPKAGEQKTQSAR